MRDTQNLRTPPELLRTLEDFASSQGLEKTMVARPRDTIIPAFVHAGSGDARAVGLVAPAMLRGGEMPGFTNKATLGEGGMGIVRLAHQQSLGRDVAIKTLRSGVAVDSAAPLSMLREAWVAGRLEHPNIAPIYDVCVDELGTPHIVMRRIVGTSWQALLEDPAKLDKLHAPRDVLDWHLRVLLQVANAVGRAHAERIIHRDIKPENVMIGQYGEVYLVDWGLAVSLVIDPSGRLPQLSDVRDIAGTPAYMAPEMLECDGTKLSEATDVYLLGASLYEIVAGAPPHSGSDLPSLLLSIAQSAPRFGPEWPGELREFCAHSMAPDIAARVANTADFRSGIEEFLLHRSSAEVSRRAHGELQVLVQDARIASSTREVLYRRFDDLRSRYQEALRGWSGNRAATDGLNAAHTAMAEYELEHGSAEAAHGLVADYEVPPELRARIQVALSGRVVDRERLEKLSRMEQQQDPSVGRLTRMFVSAVLALIGTFGPAIISWRDRDGDPTALRVGLRTTIALLVCSGLLFWARESLSKTQLNRRIALCIVLGFVNQILLFVFCLALDIPLRHHMTLNMYSWALLLFLGGIAMDRAFVLPGIAMFSGAFLGAFFPKYRFLFLPLGNLVTLITVLGKWGQPSDLRTPLRRKPVVQSE